MNDFLLTLSLIPVILILGYGFTKLDKLVARWVDKRFKQSGTGQ